jgi:hypothetical protein
MIGMGRLAWRSLFFACALLVSAPAGAQWVDFSGPWAVSGQIVAGPVFAAAIPICHFMQVGNQLSGRCRGPNGAGPASGATNGPTISWQWNVYPTTPIGLRGIASFQGTLGPDNIIRGVWTSTAVPGASGPFSAHRP